MDFYANVDDAAMKAVLGSRPNGLPNTRRERDEDERPTDATSPVADGANGEWH